MSTPNLPPLVPNASVTTPPRPGEWTCQNISLNKLADSLALPDAPAAGQDLHSIPDVWAQALSFQLALVRRITLCMPRW